MKLTTTPNPNVRPPLPRNSLPPQDQIDGEKRVLGMAASFSRLVYLDFAVCKPQLDALGATEIMQISDTISSTVAFAFLLDGRAWIVFRGSNDINDWARNVLFMPFHHFGFRKCFSDVQPHLHHWLGRIEPNQPRFCITGHSLGGALAVLAAQQLAARNCPIESLITFGGPRVMSPWQAKEFDSTKANLPDEPDKTLREITHRFRNRGEAVTQVPPFIFGFSHLGRLRDRSEFRHPAALPSVVASSAMALKAKPRTFAARLEQALDSVGDSPFGAISIVLKTMAWGIGRGAYHDITLYGRELDADESVALDWSKFAGAKTTAPQRTRIATYFVLGIFAVVVLGALFGLYLALAAIMGDSFWPMVVLALVSIVVAYTTTDK